MDDPYNEVCLNFLFSSRNVIVLLKFIDIKMLYGGGGREGLNWNFSLSKNCKKKKLNYSWWMKEKCYF